MDGFARNRAFFGLRNQCFNQTKVAYWLGFSEVSTLSRTFSRCVNGELRLGYGEVSLPYPTDGESNSPSSINLLQIVNGFVDFERFAFWRLYLLRPQALAGLLPVGSTSGSHDVWKSWKYLKTKEYYPLGSCIWVG